MLAKHFWLLRNWMFTCAARGLKTMQRKPLLWNNNLLRCIFKVCVDVHTVVKCCHLMVLYFKTGELHATIRLTIQLCKRSTCVFLFHFSLPVLQQKWIMVSVCLYSTIHWEVLPCRSYCNKWKEAQRKIWLLCELCPEFVTSCHFTKACTGAVPIISV